MTNLVRCLLSAKSPLSLWLTRPRLELLFALLLSLSIGRQGVSQASRRFSFGRGARPASCSGAVSQREFLGPGDHSGPTCGLHSKRTPHVFLLPDVFVGREGFVIKVFFPCTHLAPYATGGRKRASGRVRSARLRKVSPHGQAVSNARGQGKPMKPSRANGKGLVKSANTSEFGLPV